MKKTLFAMFAALVLLGSSVGQSRTNQRNNALINTAAPGCPACDQHTWSYSGTTGPEHWGELCAPVCSSGTRQSPIAIANAVYKALPTISYHRLSPEPRLNLKNYGFTPKISYASDPDSTYIQFSDSSVKYRFVEFHFHLPSEHTVRGRAYDMELHVVHQDESNPDSNVVIAVMIRKGLHNSKFDEILRSLPTGARCDQPSIPYQNVYDLLPRDRRSYYTYLGSLTTPDCTESVKFVVLQGQIELSSKQIDRFRTYLKTQGFDHTNRPLQDAHGRQIETNVRR